MGSVPVSPSQRSRLCKEMSTRLDDSTILDCSQLFKEDEGDEPLQRTEPSFTGIKVPRAEVRKAYLQLAKHYHPDKGGDQEMFVTLQSAYDLLTRADSVTTSASGA